jgi:cytochrome c oxidase cbb3-type subunit 2
LPFIQSVIDMQGYYVERGRIAATVLACRGVGGVNKLVLIVGGSTLVYACLTNPSANLGATEPGAYDAAKGAALYTANCSACHQASGEGLPGAIPSLKDDAVVNKDDATKHIDVVLNGMHDARVNGVVYSSAMPPFAATLSDTEIADLIDYERSSWGNHGKPIIAAQVGTERAKAK